MNYTKHAWVTGETITAEKLNNIEDGVDDLTNAISQNAESIADTQSMIATVEATTTASKNYSVGDLLVYDGKLYEVTSAIATGATIIVGSNVTQTTVEDQLGSGGGSGGEVDDVQINGTSIVSNGVANIPEASSSTFGVAKIPNNTLSDPSAYGIGVYSNNSKLVVIHSAPLNRVKQGTNTFNPIVPGNQDAATFYGLAKAAGDTTQSASANPVGTYTEEAKSAIHGMLNGAVTVSGTTPSITAKSGITYVCGEVATLDITIPASGIFEVQFVSGSTPTVLTATGVSWVGGFDPTALEANKTYDISISNGIGVAVWI